MLNGVATTLARWAQAGIARDQVQLFCPTLDAMIPQDASVTRLPLRGGWPLHVVDGLSVGVEALGFLLSAVCTESIPVAVEIRGA